MRITGAMRGLVNIAPVSRADEAQRIGLKAAMSCTTKWLCLLFGLFMAPVAWGQVRDDTIYVVSNNTTLSTLNPATGALTFAGTLSLSSSGNARDPLTGRVYYTQTNQGNGLDGSVSYFDPVTLVNTPVNSVGAPAADNNIIRLAFNTAGTLYGMGINGTLYTIQTVAPGAYTALGVVHVGIAAGPVLPANGDIAFDFNGTLYANANCSAPLPAGNACLYTINIATQVATQIGQITTGTQGALAFGPGGVLYSGGSGSQLFTVNKATGAGTAVGLATGEFLDFASMPKFADLAITKTASGVFVRGSNGAYTITVINNGPQSASGNFTVTDTLPAGLTFVSGTGTNWSCSAVGQVVTCTNTIATLANGASLGALTLTVAVAAAAPASITNTATVAGTTIDHVPGNNSSTAVTPTLPALSLSIAKTALLLCDPVNGTTNPKNIPGAIVRWTITISNAAGSGAPANLGQVSDLISGLTTFDGNLVTGAGGAAGCKSAAPGVPENATGRGFKLSLSGTLRLAASYPKFFTTANDVDGANLNAGTVTVDYAAAMPAEAGYAAGELRAGESVVVYFNVTIN